MGGPWNIVAGDLKDLEKPDAVMIDRALRRRQTRRHRNRTSFRNQTRRARVVGFTKGIRIFTSQPAVFTSFKNAQSFLNLRRRPNALYRRQSPPGVEIRRFKKRIAANLTDVEVLTRSELVYRQGMYWVIGTGAGITVLVAAALAIIVGVVIVAQTIYSATVDHIREYGTLKAMGATNFYLYKIIITQALVSGLISLTSSASAFPCYFANQSGRHFGDYRQLAACSGAVRFDDFDVLRLERCGDSQSDDD
jgi:putative ABC transport system permease protein